MLITPILSHKKPEWYSKSRPYCQCWNKRSPATWKQLSPCSCGEDIQVTEWSWEKPETVVPRVIVSDDAKQVTFHPYYSEGTAAIRGDSPLELDYHYYWEVKMLSETYGTDIMIGVGSNKVNVSNSQYQFLSLLGQDEESYGLSYRGAVRHNANVANDNAGFCRGTIVGVRVDMWQGTLEFYLNRKPQGISFYNLRRHKQLYPMLCSTAAQSSLRLTYTASWKASLLVEAAKTLASSVSCGARLRVPPGLWYTLKPHFWLTMPTEGCVLDDDGCALDDDEEEMELDSAKMVTNILSEMMPSPYVNGFYVDSVEPNYRLVVWQ